MTRDILLKRLYNKLKWRISLEDARDIIQDYKEYFAKETIQGKTEQQICEALGSPQEILKSVLNEKGEARNIRFRFYQPLFVLSILMPLFYPVISKWNDMRNLFSPYSGFLPYIFILLAPIPALILYILQRPRKSSMRISNMKVKLFYSAFGASLLITSFCSISMYRFIKQFQDYHIIDLGRIIYFSLNLSIWIIAGAWLLCIVFSEECKLFPLTIYFIYSAQVTIIFNYINVLRDMDAEDIYRNLMSDVFQPLTSLMFVAILGSIIWIIYACYINRVQDEQ